MGLRITGTDATTGKTVSLNNVDLEAGLIIENIPSESERNLTTKDDTPDTYIQPHVGGRPNDRK